jgi:hypothetical protein
LTGLLTELDAVDSTGDREVRHVRKELVKRIECESEKLESLKNEAWRWVVLSMPATSEELTKTVESEETKKTQAVTVPDAEMGPLVTAEVVAEVEKLHRVEGEDFTTSNAYAEGSYKVALNKGADREPMEDVAAYANEVPGEFNGISSSVNYSKDAPLVLAESEVLEAVAEELLVVASKSNNTSYPPRRASEPITPLCHTLRLPGMLANCHLLPQLRIFPPWCQLQRRPMQIHWACPLGILCHYGHDLTVTD